MPSNKKKIFIVDYGLGNLLSVARAFRKVGHEAEIITSGEKVGEADYLVVPGVGAFEDGMKGLEERGFVEPIRNFAKSGKPLLGICLGMQLFMTESEEFGLHKGLGLISGRVIELKSSKEVKDPDYKVPQIGWNSLLQGKQSWKGTLLENIKEGSEVYFVHSFYVPADKHPEISLAKTGYGKQDIAAVIKEGNIMGCQFHPEKSGPIGLKILETFCKL